MHLVIEQRELSRELSGMEKRHFPFLLAKTLTDLAKRGVVVARQRTKEEFDLHTDFIPQGIRFRPGSKNEVKRTGSTKSEVFTAPRISTFMPLHERGGKKVPFRSRKLSIPGRDLEKEDFRTRKGKRKTKFLPSSLLKDSKVKRRTKGRTRLPSKAFVVKKGTQRFIVRRRTKDRRDLETLYIFEGRADIKPTWKMTETVKREVENKAHAFFRKNYQKFVLSSP